MLSFTALSADCIFDDKFIHVFNALEDLEAALLLKYLPDDGVEASDYRSESEKEWQKD
jgi:hypothetical protein